MRSAILALVVLNPISRDVSSEGEATPSLVIAIAVSTAVQIHGTYMMT